MNVGIYKYNTCVLLDLYSKRNLQVQEYASEGLTHNAKLIPENNGPNLPSHLLGIRVPFLPHSQQQWTH